MLEVSALCDLNDVDPVEWDALAGAHNPFVEHAFLRLLETSKSVGPGTGWLPQHIIVRDADAGRLVGAAPTYVKTDSYGEYIFDWSWAEAAMAAGVDYYPKIVVGVPFTPATGPRMMIDPSADQDAIGDAMVQGLSALRHEVGASGVHALFVRDHEAGFLHTRGFARRGTHQYHWHNDGYETFADFLDAFKSSARKQIRKERRRVEGAGLDIEVCRGDAVADEVWSTLHRLYLHTYSRKWGRPYLTAAFFEGAAEAIGHRALIGTARQGSRIIATTLSFEKGDNLYGRYWGAFEPIDGLHFEMCFYRLIEHAIASGKQLFEAGAQGQHKLRRGFVPVTVHSAHALEHPGLHDAVERFTRNERHALDEALEEMSQGVPFRRDQDRARPRIAGLSGPERSNVEPG